MAQTATATAERPNLVPARQKEKTIVDYLRDPKVLKGLEGVATKYLSAERMTRIAINAINRTPKLLECTPQSTLGSIMFSAAIGLEPNTVLQHAYLIPRKNRRKIGNQWVDVMECQFMPGYRGYVVMAKRNPTLIKITASAICQNDHFEYQEGSETFLKFARNLEEDPGEVVGAFCFTKEKGNFGEVDSATVLPWSEIEKIRARSETWQFLVQSVNDAQNDRDRAKAERKLQDTPWVLWEGEMAAKSAIRRHVKQLDLTHGLSVVTELDAAGDAGFVDFAALADPEHAKAVAEGETPAPTVDREEREPMPEMVEPKGGGERRADQRSEQQSGPAKPANNGGQAKGSSAGDDDIFSQ